MNKIILTIVVLVTFVFAKININDDMGSFTSPDQFDKVHKVTNKTKQMIFAFKKASGHSMKEFLATKEVNYLNDKDILFVADVSAMPTVIQWFALPSLKDYPFPILVFNNDELSAQYKDEKNIEKIMLLTLKDKIVIDIKYFEDTQSLQKYIEK